MKAFKHYKLHENNLVHESTGIVDDLGRIIHEECIKYNKINSESGALDHPEIFKVIDTIYDDSNNTRVKTITNTEEPTIFNDYLKSVITERFKDFSFGIGLIESSFSTSYRNKVEEKEKSIFEYDKYGVVVLSVTSTNSDDLIYKRCVKYLNDNTDVVTILVSKYFGINEDISKFSEEEFEYGKVEKIVYDKRINKKLVHIYEDGEDLYHYDFSEGSGYTETITCINGDKYIYVYDENNNIIKSKSYRKSDDSWGCVEHKYDGLLLMEVIHTSSLKEESVVTERYVYSDIGN